MKEKILAALGWLNLLDFEGKLSITNVAVVALVIKMLIAPTLDWPSVVAMIVTFTNYMHKRQTSDGASAADDNEQMKAIKAQYEAAVVAQAKAISDIQGKVGQLASLSEMLKMGRKP